MGIVKTDIRVTREAAKRIRFYPAPPLAATNVQDAIQFAATAAIGAEVSVTAAMSPYTPPATVTILLVNTTAGPVVINTPLAATRGGLGLLVKDAVGNASVNNITINPTAPETIDGLSTVVLSSPYVFFRMTPKTGGYYDET